MSLNKKSIDDINVKGKRVLVRCDFNVPLKDGKITDENRINGALPTIQKLIKDGGKVILCSHLGKVKNGPNEGESLAPVAAALEAKLGQKVTFVADYNVTGEAATKAVSEMKEGDVVLLQNTRFRGKEETKPQEAGDAFAKELADLADVYVCDAFGSAHRAHASVAGVTKFITAKGGENVVGYLMQKEIDCLAKEVNFLLTRSLLSTTSSRRLIHLSSVVEWHTHSLKHRAMRLVSQCLMRQRLITVKRCLQKQRNLERRFFFLLMQLQSRISQIQSMLL